MLCERLYSSMFNYRTYCLNPCFSGRCSVRCEKRIRSFYPWWCLNPCFSGRCSVRKTRLGWNNQVLEQCLNPCFSGRCSVSLPDFFFEETKECCVLILVLVEDALWGKSKLCVKRLKYIRLNPCFSGRCSVRAIDYINEQIGRCVLILVLVEDALWEAEAWCEAENAKQS